MRPLRAAAVGLLCVALVAFAFRDVHLARVAEAVGSARPGLLLAALFVDALVLLAKALKWRCVFLPLRRLPPLAFLGGIAVGALAATVLPFRLDELVRGVYFGRRYGIAKPAVLGTIVVERLVDATTLLVAVGLLLLVSEPEGWLLRGATLVLAGVSLGVGAVFVFLLGRRRLGPLLSWLARGRAIQRRERLLRAIEDLAQGLSAFPRTGRFLVVFGFAALEWTLSVLCVRLTLLAFGSDLPPAGSLLLVVASYLSFAVPAVPGALGVFEALVKTALVAAYALDPAVALGYALTLHLMLVAPISLLGALVLAREGLSLADLGRLGTRGAGPTPSVDAHAGG